MPIHLVLPITLTMAGAAALINIWITMRVARMRAAHKVSIGDGGALPLIARMRAHSNFVENAPFFLILLGLIELANGPSLWLWGAGILFVFARILHAFGMDRPPGNRLRKFGAIVSSLLLVALAAWAIATPYLQPGPKPSITYASR